MTDQVAELKQRHRAMWASGDYPAVARLIASVGDAIVERAGVGEGMEVLDVAAGDGNVAIPAARVGARVTALDLTPELFESGRARAAQAGVEVEWVQGDAEDLPYETDRFDRVLSNFGVMFAPRHEVAAHEIARVCKPGGRIGLCTWLPDGLPGQTFPLIGKYMPPPPEFAQPPVQWGDESHVRDIFAGTGVELELSREVVEFGFPSLDDAIDFYQRNFGPIVMARDALTAGGRWDELAADLRALFERFNQADDGTARLRADYLVIIATKSG